MATAIRSSDTLAAGDPILVTAEQSQRIKKILQQKLLWPFYGYAIMGACHAVFLTVLPLPSEMPQPLGQQLRQFDATSAELLQSVQALENKHQLSKL